jgi:broad-specificity NMP kinase
MIKGVLKTSATTLAADTILNLAKDIKEMALKKYTSTFTVKRNESGLVYSIIAKWLVEDGIINTNKHLSVSSFYYSLDDDHKQTTLHLPPSGIYFSRLNGNVLKITLSQSTETRDTAIELTTYNDREGNLVKKINEIISSELSSDGLKIEEMSSGRYIVKPKRNIDGVILSNKNRNALMKHLDWFKRSKSLFNKFGITYKTGILLEGPPGTGKSSLAQAVASYMNMPLSIMTTSDLYTKRNEIKPRSVILIEDIDRESVAGSDESESSEMVTPSDPFGLLKKDKTKAKSISDMANQSHVGKLLNILDGALSPEGVIFIMTTNHPEQIDPALLRTGRIDLRLTLDKFTNDMAILLCEKFDIDSGIVDILGEDIWSQPAKLQMELLKLCMERERE